MDAQLCDLCGDPVDITNRATHVLVQGWLPRNKEGGGGQPLLRQVVPGHWAHEVCIRYRRQGIPIDQGRLEV